MTQAQIQLQNALTTTFLANMVFLNEYDNELYQRVENLSRMIETGEYQERYELEFVMENGDFDIFDKVTNSYLYGKNPKETNDKLINRVDFSSSNTILNIEDFFKKYEYSPSIDLSKEKVGEYDSLLQKNMQEFSTVLNDYLDNPLKKYKSIEKFVFFGVLTGRHIAKIAQKVDAQAYMVFEKNLEIFRLSLFTVDYTILGQKGVIFSIMDDTIQVENKIIQFLELSRFLNYSIKYCDVGEYVKDYANLFVVITASIRSSLYSYLRYIYVYLNRTTKYIEDAYDFLLLNSIKKSFDTLLDIPVLYLAAGPSLDENIKWIEENQDRFFIVTIGSVYKKLLNNGIKVDLVTTLDEQKWLERVQFPETIVEQTDKNTVFLASTLTHEKILKRLNNKNLTLFEVFSSFFEERDIIDGFSIGEVTLHLLLQLNIKNIYMIGLDLSLNQKTGDTHSSEAGSGTRKVDLKSKNENNILEDRKTVLKVKGNKESFVSTIPIFYSSIKSVENKIKDKPKYTKIYNLSSSGAFFEGTIPKDISKIDIEKFVKIDKDRLDFKKQLKRFTKNSLDLEEKDAYREKIAILENEIKIYLEELKNSEHKTYEEFKQILINFLYFIKDFDYSLFIIFFKYYEIVLPYLSYHFNDLRLNQEYKKVLKIKGVFISQITLLIDDYILCIKRVV
ncbi:motility associated factor glycosyltransferase family protein [Aliarcobacter skirrowii]|uniref:motility associated factor glycosyltransferase family protein n=1 Tax=Aliarcobacter skirrowii TaxID=28200 RepID=UPI00082BC9C8|nr:6-hydroxymethylpterin diphosphokinase MptE-like protein [Aliarcobacter skirrowii]